MADAPAAATGLPLSVLQAETRGELAAFANGN
jgi:hypothetical protein